MSTFQAQFVLLQHTIQPPRYAPRKTVKNKTETRTDNDDIELEAALQELMLYLLGDGVKTNVRRRTNLFNCRGHDGSKDKGMEWEDGATLEIEREAKKWRNKLRSLNSDSLWRAIIRQYLARDFMPTASNHKLNDSFWSKC
jgi:hypothetical protein